jgi:ABC-2 type transport system ATP-binding protein
VLDSPGPGTRLRLDPGTDDQAVLAAAIAAGPVRDFRRWRPPLTELYRDVVESTNPAESVPA